MSPQEWLIHLRKKHGYIHKFNIPLNDLEEVINRIPAPSRVEARKVWINRYKMTISEIQDEQMQLYLGQIAPFLVKEEKEIADSTFFGILPTHTFNGYAGFTPRGDRIIVLHEGLCYTLNFWAHWYLKQMERISRYPPEIDQAELYDSLRFILQYWYGYKPDARPEIYSETEDSWELQESLTLSAISFVLGHEIGHVLKKHPAYTPRVLLS